MPGGQPISYEAARALFRADASRAWAAYVAGAVVVLQRERGARFADSLSILVASGGWAGSVWRVLRLCCHRFCWLLRCHALPCLATSPRHPPSRTADVPEGKGVSSSAALEVAAMSALAAAHGIALEGRDLALLCQRVENAVVGALLARVLQPGLGLRHNACAQRAQRPPVPSGHANLPLVQARPAASWTK